MCRRMNTKETLVPAGFGQDRRSRDMIESRVVCDKIIREGYESPLRDISECWVQLDHAALRTTKLTVLSHYFKKKNINKAFVVRFTET